MPSGNEPKSDEEIKRDAQLLFDAFKGAAASVSACTASGIMACLVVMQSIYANGDSADRGAVARAVDLLIREMAEIDVQMPIDETRAGECN